MQSNIQLDVEHISSMVNYELLKKTACVKGHNIPQPGPLKLTSCLGKSNLQFVLQSLLKGSISKVEELCG